MNNKKPIATIDILNEEFPTHSIKLNGFLDEFTGTCSACGMKFRIVSLFKNSKNIEWYLKNNRSPGSGKKLTCDEVIVKEILQ